MRQTAAEHWHKLNAAAREVRQKERQERRAQQQILKHWPADLPFSKLHVYPLYGRAASVTIGDSYTRYGQEDDRCTLEEVIELLEKLPPVPTVKHKDGCVSFRTAAYEDPRDKDREPDIEPVFGVLLQIEPGIKWESTQSINWFTELAPGLVVEVECILRQDAWPVDVKMHVRRDRSTGKVLEVYERSIHAKGTFWLDQRISWGRGSEEDPGKWTCYWIGIDDSKGAAQAFREICGNLIK